MIGGPVVGYAGLSHLGLVSAVAAAARGFETVGYDPDAGKVAAIRKGALPIVEPGLDTLFAAQAGRLRVSDGAAALAGCDLVYLALDIATDDGGESDLAPVRDLLARMTPHLRADAVLVVLCQAPPGFTRALRWPAARLYYQVETLIFGRAVERATQPERFIVGCADPSHALPTALAVFLEAFNCPILPMRYESAELAKLSINLCLAATVGIANTLAELSERLGADWEEIAPALRLDKRIGAFAYLKPGLGLAGGNLERDLAGVARLADANASEAGIVRAIFADSAYRRDWLLREVKASLPDFSAASRLAVLGLAYKENTDSIKNSAALALIRALPGIAVAGYDPAVGQLPPPSPDFVRAATASAACAGADAVILATPWLEFRAIDPVGLKTAMRGRLVIDPYRLLDPAACRAAGLSYRTLGRKEEAC
jgi:UDPglucose 6-dehydrogenase